jgi:glutathione S-transferase
MSDRKLHYFGVNARGGIIRAILYYTKTPFEDVKYTFESWAGVKNSGDFEFNQLPMLESNGLKMIQSGAIILELANEFNLLGSNAQERYLNTSLLFNLEDVLPKLVPAVFGMSSEAIANMPVKAKEFLEVHSPAFLTKYEERFKKYGGKYAIGDNFSLSDIIYTFIIQSVYRNSMRKDTWEPVLLQYAPTLAAHATKIAENELAEYFQKGYVDNCPL